MKIFEEIYWDVVVWNGCNVGKMFVRVMFEEGMSQNFECCMDRVVGFYMDFMVFVGWFGKCLVREFVRCNVVCVNFFQDIIIEGRKYVIWFGMVIFCMEEKKSFEECVEEIVGRLLLFGLLDDLKMLLKEVVLIGYDLQKDDFDED